MRHSQRGISRLAFTLFSVYAILIIAAVVSMRIGATPTSADSSDTSHLPTISFGSNGVRSSAIMTENERPGNPTWRIAPGTSSTAIQGYATAVQAQVGQILNLYVTTASPHYVIEAFRMGWYRGAGARLVWRSAILNGINQPACTLDGSANMVACWNWKPSAQMPISTEFTPGDYLLKLVTGAGASSYIPLTVWDPTSTATYVVLNRSLGEEAENAYGGFSLYAGQGSCIIDQTPTPPCNRARVVSFDRPYATGDGAADYLTNEYPLVSLLEQEGLDVTYITDITLSTYPNVLSAHKVLISLGHDASWTDEARVALRTAQAHGLNAIFLGADAMEAHVRLEPSILGLNRQVVDYRNAAEDPLAATAPAGQITSNTWEDPPASWPPLAQTGQEYAGRLNPERSAPMVVTDPTSWAFHGTGLTPGASLPGVVASDFAHASAASAGPHGLDVLAHSPVRANESSTTGALWNGVSYSDMTYFSDPVSHAGTFATGTSGWIPELTGCPPGATGCTSTVLTAITNNVLRVFGEGPAGLRAPSTGNLASVAPVGS